MLPLMIESFTLSIQHKLLAIVCLVTLPAIQLAAQQQSTPEGAHQIVWYKSPEALQFAGQNFEVFSFRGALLGEEFPGMPFWTTTVQLNGPQQINPELTETVFEPAPKQSFPENDLLGEQISIRTKVEKVKNRWVAKIYFIPIIKEGTSYQRLVSFRLKINSTPLLYTAPRGPLTTNISELSSGNIYKLAVKETGIHKLTYDFLKNDLGLPIDQINPAKIRILGRSGGMLPESLLAEVADDLPEHAIEVVGAADGRFDPQDYILFYASGPDVWHYDEASQSFSMTKHLYDTQSYYFLKVDAEDGKRILPTPSLTGASYLSNTFDDFDRFEEDKSNLMHDWDKSQGSGKKWYGDHFLNARSYTYNNLFNFPDLDPGSSSRIVAEMAIRALTRSSFTVKINNQSFQSNQAARVSRLSGVGDNEVDYAKTAILEKSATLSGPDFDVVVEYPFPGGSGDGSEAWLDYIEVNVRQKLNMQGSQLSFRDTRSLQYPVTQYILSKASDKLRIWDVSQSQEPQNQEFSRQGNEIIFGAAGDQLRTFVAFDPEQNLLRAEAIGRIPNQNLHGVTDPDMLIIYHPDFESEALRLKAHRETFSNLKISLASVEQVYNEFSSGAADPTAIRNFARLCYERSPDFRFLLLLGDGSFDQRDIYQLGGNFLPVYQTESFNPIFAFPSDDYYAILEPASLGDPTDPLSGRLDIAVGRIPVNAPEQASLAVDKIIRYDLEPASFSNWRNQLSFIGDDEDGQRHMLQADEIAGIIESSFPVFNLEKIYLDAFTQVSTPGGERYPEVNEAINQSMFRGNLVMTYLGHGGSQGLAQERVMNITDIRSWENTHQMPLFVTATCSFTGYDDAGFTTAGEEVFLNPKGGAFALLTTTRAVLSSQNKLLTEQVLIRLFERDGDSPRAIGTVMQLAKNSFTGGGILSNSRKFALIGDPSQKLAIPTWQVQTTMLNSSPADPATPDTLKALQKINIRGKLTDLAGNLLEDFNGTLYPTIYDKKVTLSTLGQDPGSPVKPFDIQKNIIFKGKATVSRGTFEFTFVVPKDINFEPGPGKISYYAADPSMLRDAHGYYDNVIIGGTDPNILSDREGPEIGVFMNTQDFVFGGITDPDPTLLVLLSDENGINVVGNSIGHDLEAILDEDTQNTLVLNDYYTADQDNYTRGTVRYPLTKLEPGRHQIRIKAWDVANNSAQAATEFVVFDGTGIKLEHVLNYPNPFTDHTCFQFDHNYANQELSVVIRIFTVSGKQVKTIRHQMFSDGAIRLDDCIPWDGTDDYGDRLARGVYLYKINVASQIPGSLEVKGESGFEKLVILK